MVVHDHVTLEKQLNNLRHELASAAQSVIDNWEQDDDGISFDLGEGGVCDQVAEAMSSVIDNALSDISVSDGGQDGDDHAFIIVYDEKDAFSVDIPPGIYETGGGYSWKKIKDAKISPDDIVIWRVDRDLVSDW